MQACTKISFAITVSPAGIFRGGAVVPIRFMSFTGMSNVAHGLIIAALIVLFLYVAGPIVEPLVIAGLLSFILAPVMRRLRTFGVPKAVAAIACVALTLSVIGVLGTTLGLQVRQLAEDLPSYENNLRAKIQMVGGTPLAPGVLERASGTLRDLQDELSHAERGSTPARRNPTASRRDPTTRAEGPRGDRQSGETLAFAAGDKRARYPLPAVHPPSARGYPRPVSPPRRDCRPAAQHRGTGRCSHSARSVLHDAGPS